MATNNGYVTREAARFVRAYKDVPLPDGSKARIQTLNNREKEELKFSLLDRTGKPDLHAAIVGGSARLLVAAWVDGDGKRLYDDGEEAALQDEIDPDIIDYLGDEIIEFAGINHSGIERLKKKYNSDPDSNSPTS